MRELKFRAWDTKTKKMIETGFHLLGEVMAFDLLYQYGMENNPDKEVGLLRLNDIVIMEYTGLKDKNGKEIYERDILQFETGTVRQVVYQAPSFVMKRNIKDKSWTEFALAPTENQFETVIGNIYENPELLVS